MMGEKSRDVELAELVLKFVVAFAAGTWVLVTGKDLVDARKNEGEMARTEVLTTQDKWNLRPRGVASITSIPSGDQPWITDSQLCSISGSYSLTNKGGAPINVRSLIFQVYEVPLTGAPAPSQQVVSFSANTRIAAGTKIFEESLPDSEGNLLPEETYSRGFGYTIRRKDSMQYVVIANPTATFPIQGREDPLPEGQFRAWTNLTPICQPTLDAGAPSAPPRSRSSRSDA